MNVCIRAPQNLATPLTVIRTAFFRPGSQAGTGDVHNTHTPLPSPIRSGAEYGE